ncbi:DUF4232 domain-containing protein [Streptomyces purpurogeneiscleroticus]|uniref:DUF4232 domain-containing protein n=1 Tax=Streptomyces purpurogeneiscleroticus TaxID=68259 RepID=UPI001CBEFA40|nr:DUF4232 domain-containing protein [Streptomyces purpurogeneiscleroticus]
MSHLTSLRRGRKAATATLIAAAAALALTACQDDGSGVKSGAPAAPSAAASDSGADSGSASDSSSAASGSSSAEADGGGSAASQSPSGQGAKGTAVRTASARTAAAASTDTSSDRCTADELGLRLGRADVGAGNIRYPLVFTNNGKTSCTLRGYPGVSLIQRDGQMIGKPATREGAAGKAVTLKPGGSAYAVLHTIQDGLNDEPCWKSPYLLQTYPPGSKDAMTLRTSELRVCGGEFSVTALEPGVGR